MFRPTVDTMADRRPLELLDGSSSSSNHQFLQEDYSMSCGITGAIGKVDSILEDAANDWLGVVPGAPTWGVCSTPKYEQSGTDKRRKTIPKEDSSDISLHVSGEKEESNAAHWYSSNPYERDSVRGSRLVHFDDDDEEDDDEIIDTVLMTGDHLPHPAYSLTKSLVAKTMCKLSMKQREAVYHDIHGVQDAIDEDAEEDFLVRKLSEMEDEIQNIEAPKKSAYEMARSANRRFVDDPEFRLRFLRADRFDPQLAATRYTKHYQTKLELFGEDKLGKQICQDDLGREALDNVYSGMNQILPRRDNAGRLVWVWITGAQQQKQSDNAVLRRMFYNNMIISEDVETQRKGSIGVIYTLNQPQTRRGAKGNLFLRRLSDMVGSLPMSIVGIHFCYENYAWLPVLSIVQLSMHLFVRLRFRVHFGTHRECICQLQTFGIPADTIPIGERGKIHRDTHVRLFKKRRKQEQAWVLASRKNSKEEEGESTSSSRSNSSNSNDTTSGEKKSGSTDCDDGSAARGGVGRRPPPPLPPRITIPAKFDVLLGRGRGYFNHIGNIRYRTLIENLKERYDGATMKKCKKSITEEVLEAVHTLGGRFLKDNDGAWVPIDDRAAREKIAHSFRALRCGGVVAKQGRAEDTSSTSKRKDSNSSR